MMQILELTLNVLQFTFPLVKICTVKLTTRPIRASPLTGRAGSKTIVASLFTGYWDGFYSQLT